MLALLLVLGCAPSAMPPDVPSADVPARPPGPTLADPPPDRPPGAHPERPEREPPSAPPEDTDGGQAAAVKAVVRQYQGQVRSCYEAELATHPDLAGDLEVEWTVAGGLVTEARIASDTTGDAALGDCVLKHLRTWRFDGVDDGEIAWPFKFRAR